MKKLVSVVVWYFVFSGPLHALERHHSVGVGLPYAGLLGYQLAFTDNEVHQYRVAIGIIGFGVGYDYRLTNNWSVGASYVETIRQVYAVNTTYHFDSMASGFKLGLDLGYMPEDSSNEGFFRSNGSKTVLWLHLGYSF